MICLRNRPAFSFEIMVIHGGSRLHFLTVLAQFSRIAPLEKGIMAGRDVGFHTR
jgi:hypothetical protein